MMIVPTRPAEIAVWQTAEGEALQTMEGAQSEWQTNRGIS
jgi:hypothetical protein